MSGVAIKQIASSRGDHENIYRALDFAISLSGTLRISDQRTTTTQATDIAGYFLLHCGRNSPSLSRCGAIRATARPRGTTAEKLRVVADTAPEAPAATVAASKSDPRLVNLVRLLARQAARDFVQAETDRRKRDRLPE
ncbi:hypothetical protein ACVWXO_000478 [Bradyrhizobium sp. LM2.7]